MYFQIDLTTNPAVKFGGPPKCISVTGIYQFGCRCNAGVKRVLQFTRRIEGKVNALASSDEIGSGVDLVEVNIRWKADGRQIPSHGES